MGNNPMLASGDMAVYYRCVKCGHGFSRIVRPGDIYHSSPRCNMFACGGHYVISHTDNAIASAAHAGQDAVDHPPHYTSHPSGVECIAVTEHMNFCLGNAVKYIWRADEKGKAIQDLKKAIWYLEREIARREKA